MATLNDTITGDSSLQDTTNPIIQTISFASEAALDKAEMVFIQLDRTTMLITDSVSGVWTWDTTSGPPDILKDLVPYLPDSLGVTDGAALLDACIAVTPGKYATWHRNRIFLCNPDTSNVWYSGTRTDLLTREDTPRAIRPWELWNRGADGQSMDLSRYNPGYGGAMIVGSPSQRITGIVSTENGLLILKEQSIYIWNWPDSAAPHEVSNGATIKKFVDGIGCVSSATISQVGDVTYFVGRDGFNNVGLFALKGGELARLSDNIPRNMALVDIVNSKPMGAVSENYYFLAYDNGEGEVQIRNVYDIQRGAWVDFTTPPVSCFGSFPAAAQMLVGTPGGNILQYPSPWYQDYNEAVDDNVAIPFKVRSRIVDDESQSRDKKFRKVWNVMETAGDVEVSTQLLYDEEAAAMVSPPVLVADADAIKAVRFGFTNYFWNEQYDAWVAREPLKMLGLGFDSGSPDNFSASGFRSRYFPNTTTINSQELVDDIDLGSTTPWVFAADDMSSDFDLDIKLGARPVFYVTMDWDTAVLAFSNTSIIAPSFTTKILPSLHLPVFDLLTVEYTNNGVDWHRSSYYYFGDSPHVVYSDQMAQVPREVFCTYDDLPASFTIVDPGTPDEANYTTVNGLQTIEVPTRERAKSLQVVISGATMVKASIHSIMAGWRSRTEK